MNRLLDGYRRFRARSWPARRSLFEALAREGQRPLALVIACSDSRVDPTMIFDAAPGELFVVRNVANLVPPYAPDAEYHGTSAAIEFAVRALAVPQVIVLGHAMCGGIAALLEGAPATVGDFVASWITIAEPARARALACEDPTRRQTIAEEAAVQVSLDNLRSFPWIAERVQDGRLVLTGATFDIRSGLLRLLGPDGGFGPA
jgi:carbonic anhydrase